MTIHELSFDFVVFDSKRSKDQILEDCNAAILGYGLGGKYELQMIHLSRSLSMLTGDPERTVTVQVIPNPVVKIHNHGTDRFFNQTSEITENEYNFWLKVK